MQAAQLRQLIYAGIVGDAFGVPVEFKARGTYQVTQMTGHGTWDQPRGSWSDDSAMTLALIDNLTTGGSYADLFEKFQAYMMWGAYTPREVMLILRRLVRMRFAIGLSINYHQPLVAMRLSSLMVTGH